MNKTPHKLQLLRFIEIDRQIREGRYPSAPALARQFEVSDKTVKRDIEFLRDSLHAPIEYDRSRKGYYYTGPDFYLPAIHISEEDFFMLTVSRQILEQYRNTPLKDAVEGILIKLGSLLPEQVTLDPAWLNDSLSFISEKPRDHDPEIWRNLFRALKNKKAFQMEYFSPTRNAAYKRVLYPYHVVCYKNDWYVIGKEPEKSDIYSYAISRINSGKVMSTSFSVPDDFKPEDYLGHGYGIFKKVDSFEVILHFSAQESYYVQERIWHESQRFTELTDGSIEMTFQTQHLYEVKRWVLSWGAEVEVRAPDELKKAVKEELEKMGRLYDLPPNDLHP